MELDLSNEHKTRDEKKLAELPESIGKLKQLTSLNLYNNQLTTLPASLGQLTQLTELDIPNNQLTTLPNLLGQLTQLRELTVNINKLIALPDSLHQLAKLETLYIQVNNFDQELPDIIGSLTNDLMRRVHEHKNKLAPGFTSKYNIQFLVYYESTPSIHVALEREKQIKGWLRAKKIALIDSLNPEWKDLSEEWYV